MERINICMSGGRTSAYMTEKLLSLQLDGCFEGFEFVITFANTGREHIETLKFVNRCTERWLKLYGVPVIWLECVVHEGRIASTHKVVDFQTASRAGEVFEDVVKKYGLPNGNFLHCTRELKENPITSYMTSLGETVGTDKLPATYQTYIGIRSDEPKRLNGNKSGKQSKVYPLAGDLVGADDADLTCDKQDVLDFWESMPFDLYIPEHLGNCIDCHKKSTRKLFKVARDAGEAAFEFTAYLDDQYCNVKAQVLDGKTIKRKRFRGYLDTRELIQLFRSSEFDSKNRDDESGGCSESCEAFM